MRVLLAKGAAVLIGIIIVALAGGFAYRQNVARFPGGSASGDVTTTDRPAPLQPESPVDRSVADRGRALFDEQGCARCHAIAGRGNPRSPLDGVGARRAADDIRSRIVAAPSVRQEMSASVIRAKERFLDLAPSDLDALTEYLVSLR